MMNERPVNIFNIAKTIHIFSPVNWVTNNCCRSAKQTYADRTMCFGLLNTL